VSCSSLASSLASVAAVPCTHNCDPSPGVWTHPRLRHTPHHSSQHEHSWPDLLTACRLAKAAISWQLMAGGGLIGREESTVMSEYDADANINRLHSKYLPDAGSSNQMAIVASVEVMIWCCNGVRASGAFVLIGTRASAVTPCHSKPLSRFSYGTVNTRLECMAHDRM